MRAKVLTGLLYGLFLLAAPTIALAQTADTVRSKIATVDTCEGDPVANGPICLFFQVVRDTPQGQPTTTTIFYWVIDFPARQTIVPQTESPIHNNQFFFSLTDDSFVDLGWTRIRWRRNHHDDRQQTTTVLESKDGVSNAWSLKTNQVSADASGFLGTFDINTSHASVTDATAKGTPQ